MAASKLAGPDDPNRAAPPVPNGAFQVRGAFQPPPSSTGQPPPRTDEESETYAFAQRTACQIGDRILAAWEPTFLYVGRIANLTEDHALVDYEDGGRAWVTLEQIQPLALTPDQCGAARRDGPFYFPCTILDLEANAALVRFDDASRPEWLPLAQVRVPCEAAGPPAWVVESAYAPWALDAMLVGHRVWAPWHAGELFAATVTAVRGDDAHVRFDNGDEAWVLIAQMLPLTIPEGIRLFCRWRFTGQYHAVKVLKVKGERIRVRHEDGSRTWTTPAALMMPCPPFGPHAEPTKVLRHWTPLGRLLLAAALAVVAGLLLTIYACL